MCGPSRTNIPCKGRSHRWLPLSSADRVTLRKTGSLPPPPWEGAWVPGNLLRRTCTSWYPLHHRKHVGDTWVAAGSPRKSPWELKSVASMEVFLWLLWPWEQLFPPFWELRRALPRLLREGLTWSPCSSVLPYNMVWHGLRLWNQTNKGSRSVSDASYVILPFQAHFLTWKMETMAVPTSRSLARGLLWECTMWCLYGMLTAASGQYDNCKFPEERKGIQK